jgi:hypothetical protein
MAEPFTNEDGGMRKKSAARLNLNRRAAVKLF